MFDDAIFLLGAIFLTVAVAFTAAHKLDAWATHYNLERITHDR